MLVVTALVSLSAAGCSADRPGSLPTDSPASGSGPGDAPARTGGVAFPRGDGTASPGGHAVADVTDGPLSGTVAETVNAGGYTYVRLTRETCDVWVAAREFLVAVGDPLTVAVDMTMRDFHSPSLNRTFPAVHFASRVARRGETLDTAGPTARSSTTRPIGSPAEMRSHGGTNDSVAQSSHASASVAPSVTRMTPPPGGMAVADVFARRRALTGQRIVVRGEVVKINRGILDRDWLHLQDGTGSAATGDHDLAVTTRLGATAAVPGDVITLTGIVAVNKDVGAGYAYEVILEEASPTR